MPADVYTPRGLLHELHELLYEIDPARWRAEKEHLLRGKVRELEERIAATIESAREDSSGFVAALVELQNALAQHASAMEGSATDLHQSWDGLRLQVQPIYEGIAQSLTSGHVEVPHLRPTNYTRNLFHVLAAVGCLVFVELSPTFAALTIVAGAFCLAGWTMEIARRVSTRANELLMWVFSKVAHPHEAYKVNSSTWYTTALLAISFTESRLACAVAIGVLGFGDPIAALVGRRYGRTRLINGRTLEGSIAFFASGALVAAAVMAVWHPDLGAGRILLLSGVAALVGAVVELGSRRVDDNFAIPVMVAGMLYVLLGLGL